MADLKKMKKEREEDIRQSLRFIDTYVAWIKQTPNEIWSKKQADLFRSVYISINADWRKSRAKSRS